VNFVRGTIHFQIFKLKGFAGRTIAAAENGADASGEL